MFISGLSYSVDEWQPLEKLSELGLIAPGEISQFVASGLRGTYHETRPLNAMVRSCTDETFRKSGRSVKEVDGVVMITTSGQWREQDEAESWAALLGIGIDRCVMVGLSHQASSGFPSALYAASSLIRSEDATCVLVLIHRRNADLRVTLEGSATVSLFGDGIASCLVSRDRGDLEIVSTSMMSAPGGADTRTPTWSELLERLKLLAGVAEKLYQRAQITPEDIDILFTTNATDKLYPAVSQATGIDLSRIRTEDLGDFAHIGSCDNVIGIARYGDLYGHRAGAYYMALNCGHATHTGAILRCVSTRSFG